MLFRNLIIRKKNNKKVVPIHEEANADPDHPKSLPHLTRPLKTNYGESIEKTKQLDIGFANSSESAENEVCPDKLRMFNLELVIGKGGFGKVLLVSHKTTKKLYALKAINKGENVQDILRERANMSDVASHPFVAKLRMAFEARKKFFMVLDFYPGGDLHFHLRKHQRLTRDAATFYTAELCSALAYIHHCQILFRDVKPENIMLDADGHIKLSDFGLSKLADTTTWDSGTVSVCGTPCYMAPEAIACIGGDQSINKDGQVSSYGYASDWWSVGIVLYEMIVGFTPYRGADTYQIFYNIRASPLTLLARWDSEMKHFLRNILKKRPGRRLGVVGGVDEITSHPFFQTYRKYASPQEIKQERNKHGLNSVDGASDCIKKGIDFAALERRELEAPIRPDAVRTATSCTSTPAPGEYEERNDDTELLPDQSAAAANKEDEEEEGNRRTVIDNGATGPASVAENKAADRPMGEDPSPNPSLDDSSSNISRKKTPLSLAASMVQGLANVQLNVDLDKLRRRIPGAGLTDFGSIYKADVRSRGHTDRSSGACTRKKLSDFSYMDTAGTFKASKLRATGSSLLVPPFSSLSSGSPGLPRAKSHGGGGGSSSCAGGGMGSSTFPLREFPDLGGGGGGGGNPSPSKILAAKLKRSGSSIFGTRGGDRPPQPLPPVISSGNDNDEGESKVEVVVPPTEVIIDGERINLADDDLWRNMIK